MSVHAFAAALSQLLGWSPDPDLVRTWESDVPPPGQVVIACEIIASRAAPAGAAAVGDQVAAAAREAEADQLRLLAETGEWSVDSLWEGILEVARGTNASAAEMFRKSHQLCCHAVNLAGDTRRPGVLADLYLIAGQANALMASTAFDLDRWDESATLTRSAISYAALIGNPSLHAWTLGLAALLANWRNEPYVALDHVRHGIEIAPVGTPGTRLRYIAARSYALLGDPSSVGRMLDQAHRERDHRAERRDLLSEEVAGEFAFGVARAEACAAAAWLDLGRGGEAAAAARRALDDLTALPARLQPLSVVTGARIDLASACLLQRDRDQAEAILRQVIAAPSALTNVSLAGRLARTKRILASAYWSRDPVALRLNDSIGSWRAGQP